jgi:formate dehydrogenase subunit gamma
MPAAQPAPSAEAIDMIIEEHRHLEGPLLPLLHAIQDAFGHVPDAAVPQIARAFNLAKAEVHGVVSFYHDFRSAPAGRHVVKICRAEACQSRGADAMAEETLRLLGLEWHGTSPDGRVTVEPVYCLGLCACGPAAMVDGRVHGRLDAARMRDLLEGVGA